MIPQPKAGDGAKANIFSLACVGGDVEPTTGGKHAKGELVSLRRDKRRRAAHQ
jgi:hypothetical protein